MAFHDIANRTTGCWAKTRELLNLARDFSCNIAKPKLWELPVFRSRGFPPMNNPVQASMPYRCLIVVASELYGCYRYPDLPHPDTGVTGSSSMST